MSSDGILGIKNRTENWKTAYYFAPFFRDDSAKLRLAERLGTASNTLPLDVHIELYWKGMRDYFHQEKQPTRNNPSFFGVLAERYVCLFPELREEIKRFDSSGNELRLPEKWNYNSRDAKGKLASNLINSEFDVVIQTPNHLFVGEAKGESGLGTNGKYVLVHQLIRQHVMAKILVDFAGDNLEVQHFLVGDACKLDSLKNTAQVKFMKQQKWLDKKNVLCWKCVKAIAEGKETCHG